MTPTATTTGTHRALSSASHAVHVPVLSNFIGGKWVDARASGTIDVKNPATGRGAREGPALDAGRRRRRRRRREGGVPGVARDARRCSARATSSSCRTCSRSTSRSSARICTPEHGKTLDESRGSDCGAASRTSSSRAACPSLMMGQSLEDIATGIDCDVHPPAARRVRGHHAVQLPGDGAALVPAVRDRDRQHVRRSSRASRCRSRSSRIFELLEQAGFPPGVVNLVNGGKDVVERASATHPGIAGVSFVGSTPVAQHVYKRGGETRQARARRSAARRTSSSSCPTPTWTRRSRTSSPSRATAAPASAASRAASSSPSASAYERGARAARRGARRRSRSATACEPGVTMGPVISRAHREQGARRTSRRASRRARSSSLDGRGATGRRAARTATGSARRSSTTCTPT